MSDSNQVVVFGELLMRLGTMRHERFVQVDALEVGLTGAETNAVVSLVHYGLPCEVVSAVPPHEIGQRCINFLRQHGVGTKVFGIQAEGVDVDGGEVNAESYHGVAEIAGRWRWVGTRPTLGEP